MASRLVTVSFSELDTFRQCPLKWQLSYSERWVSPKSGLALRRGTVWHQVLEVWYAVVKEMREKQREARKTASKISNAQILDDAHEAAIEELRLRSATFSPDEREEELTRLVWMLDGHIEKWELDEQWEIVAIEYPFVIPLPLTTGKASRFRLKGKVDLIVRELDVPGTPLSIIDHKSGANLPTQKELDIDDQFGFYTWAMRVLGNRIHGVIHSANRTKMNKGDLPGATLNGNVKMSPLEARLSRTWMHRSDKELDAIAVDATKTATEAYRKPLIPGDLRSAPNPDQCKWKCDLLDAHLAARKSGSNIRDVLDAVGMVQNFERH